MHSSHCSSSAGFSHDSFHMTIDGKAPTRLRSITVATILTTAVFIQWLSEDWLHPWWLLVSSCYGFAQGGRRLVRTPEWKLGHPISFQPNKAWYEHIPIHDLMIEWMHAVLRRTMVEVSWPLIEVSWPLPLLPSQTGGKWPAQVQTSFMSNPNTSEHWGCSKMEKVRNNRGNVLMGLKTTPVEKDSEVAIRNTKNK